MIITGVKIRYIEGNMPATIETYDGERHARMRYLPTDAHYNAKPEADVVGNAPALQADGTRKLKQPFLLIATSEGITGVAGPIAFGNAGAIIEEIRGIAANLRGQDPFNTERLWDILYRASLTCGGSSLTAVSLLDIALWDIKGKAAGLPLYQMLGGATQQRLPVYASCTVDAFDDDAYDLDAVRKTTEWCVKEGYVGGKWWVHRGPRDGDRGIGELAALFSAIREAGGPEFKVMCDVWSAWDYDYALRAARRLAPLDLYWLEEPLMPLLEESYARLNRNSPIRIASGEHNYTRWGFKRLLDRNAYSIYQPDPVWCGGVTETMKILALMSAYDATVALHYAFPNVTVHINAVCPPHLAPVAEYLLNISNPLQYFYQIPAVPVNGFYELPQQAGVGMDIDEAKVTAETIVDIA